MPANGREPERELRGGRKLTVGVFPKGHQKGGGDPDAGRAVGSRPGNPRSGALTNYGSGK